jgi:hypothetical protein
LWPVEKLFRDVDAGACDATFTSGHDGKVNHGGQVNRRRRLSTAVRIAGEALEEQVAAEI